MLFEPDIIFSKDFNKRLSNINNHDIIYLGASQHNWDCNPVNGKPVKYIDGVGYYANHTTGTFGIVLKHTIFKDYLEILNTETFPSDMCLMILQNHYNSIVLTPNLVVANVTESQIADNRNMINIMEKFGWTMNNYCLNILTNVFDKIYVINLKQHKTKRANINEQFKMHGIIFEFVDGVYGKKDKECNRFFDQYQSYEIGYEGSSTLEKQYNRKMMPTVGSVGYLMTMKNILTNAKENNLNKILVFDDDVILSNDFTSDIVISMANIPKMWNILRLGTSQYVTNGINRNQALNNGYYETPQYTDGSFAVGYNSKTFDILLNEIEKFNITFDSGPLRIVNNKLGGDYTIYPYLVVADVSVSDTGKDRNIVDVSKMLGWNLNDFTIKYIQIKVSIIIPLYNRKKTVINCIQSLLNQSYKNIEIIIVDDCSTDCSYDIVLDFIKNYKGIMPIFLHKTKVNGGCYAARNVGLKYAKGEYIAFQDTDDYSLPNRIEVQMDDIIKRGISISFCQIYRFNNNDVIWSCIGDKLIKQVKADSHPYDNVICPYKYKFKMGMVTSIIKRSLFDKYGFYDDKFRHSMDLGIIEKFYCLEKNISPYSIDHMWTFISDNTDDKFMYMNSNMLYICEKMDDNNITNNFNNEDRKNIMEKWKADIDKKMNALTIK